MDCVSHWSMDHALLDLDLVILLIDYTLDQGSQTFPLKSQRVNILGFSDHIVSHNYSILLL